MTQNLEARFPRLAIIAIFLILLIDICATTPIDSSEADDVLGRNGDSDSNRQVVIPLETDGYVSDVTADDILHQPGINGLHRNTRSMICTNGYIPIMDKSGIVRCLPDPRIIGVQEGESRIPDGEYEEGSCPCPCELGEAPNEITTDIPVSRQRQRRGQPDDPMVAQNNRMEVIKYRCVRRGGTCRRQVQMEDK